MDAPQFFNEIDRLLSFEQTIYEALGDDPEYYKLYSIKVEHRCQGNQIWVYVERAGILWLCNQCRESGII
ncbi:MAG: hypothetical protein HYR55_19460 [Acidobacteria bacterium]|nr:hypothetical protein [Acidobacteriota bacterium]MBI3655912.1 hypothetical protein [Acidobacteriota bacterium]